MSELGNHDHLHSQEIEPGDRARYEAGRRSTLVSVAVNLTLAVLQIAIGWFGRSQALFTDGLHTLSDLLSDFLVLFASRQGSKKADEDHPYGHRRLETAATLILGVGLFAVGLSILYAAGTRLTSAEPFVRVHVLTLWMALATLAAKETLYHYLIRVARKHRSQMLAANAWHSRADAATSLVGAAGIAGNLLGYTFLDTLAAALVAFMIARMGWKLGYQALAELVDTGLDEAEVEGIRQTLASCPGVRGIHDLRTRRMAGQALVDAHVLVDPRISVSEGHYIAERARAAVLDGHDVIEVLVHVDPEDDRRARPSVHLPARPDLLPGIEAVLADLLPAPERVVLHYLDGQVDVEIFLPRDFPGAPELASELRRRLAALQSDTEPIRSIRVHQAHAL